MSSPFDLSKEQRDYLNAELVPIAKENAPKLWDATSDYLHAEAPKEDLVRLEDARVKLAAAKARLEIATDEEREVALYSVGNCDSILASVLDEVRIAERWEEIHSAGNLLDLIKDAAAAATPALLEIGTQIAKAKFKG